MADEHWAQTYIGRPYAAVGKCWGLCRLVWREHFAIEVPDVAVDPGDHLAVRRAFRDFGEGHSKVEAERVARPYEGVAAYMTRANLPDHIGIYIEAARGGVLHAVEPRVVFTPSRALETNGFHIVAFYRPKGLPCPLSMS